MTIAARRRFVGITWVGVGLLLVWRGSAYAGWWPSARIQGLSGADRWLALGLALALGVVKGSVALRRSAHVVVGRIVRRGAEAPAWSVFSPLLLLLVAAMVPLGLLLRLSPYDPSVKAWLVGILYPAVGVALMIGGYHAVRVPPFDGPP